MESEQKAVWRLANAYVIHRREASFGSGRMSETGSAYAFSWDIAKAAFVYDRKGEVMMGTWITRIVPCDPRMAANILTLCADEAVQKRFLFNMYASVDEEESYPCGDTTVTFRLKKAVKGQGFSFLYPASFSFEFSSPDGTLQTISLSSELCQSLVTILKGMSLEQIWEKAASEPIPAIVLESPPTCSSNNCDKLVSDPSSKYCDDCLASVEEDAGWQMHINGFSE